MSIASTKLMGGLGNYMFQISAAYSIAKRDGKELICDYSDHMVPHKPFSEYTNNLFRKIKFSNNVGKYTHVGESGFNYKILPKIEGSVRLNGYFQSEKYFKEIRNEILNLFDLPEDIKKKVEGKYKGLLKQDTCSLHVRRGDYLGLPNHHPTQTIEYYNDSINIIGLDKTFVIFSDDINWCKENLDFIPNKFFISGNEDYEDMYLMSLCNHNIIANSTFSWWGAWLNKNDTKKVIAPKQWFGVSNSHLDTSDLYCEKWITI
jgi:hypothetical protein